MGREARISLPLTTDSKDNTEQKGRNSIRLYTSLGVSLFLFIKEDFYVSQEGRDLHLKDWKSRYKGRT